MMWGIRSRFKLQEMLLAGLSLPRKPRACAAAAEPARCRPHGPLGQLGRSQDP